jgi:hypothetical protein
MKLTEKTLKKMIAEAIDYEADREMEKVHGPLEMSKDLELFIESVLDGAQQYLEANSNYSEEVDTDKLYSILLTQMAPGTFLATKVAILLAKEYQEGTTTVKHDDPLDY